MKIIILLLALLSFRLQAQPTLPEINQFSNTFLKQIREKGKNTFCSPLGVSYVNAMLYAGAAGVTKSELETVMKFNGSSFDQFDAFSKQINEINTREQVEIRIANGIWNRIILKDSFKKIIEEKFDSESFKLTTEAPINKWAEDKTNGKIKDLLAPGSITPDVVMVLANAIYFKGDWLYKFDSLKTEKEWFYKEDGSKAKTKLMHIESSFSYAENDDYQALELPYKGDELVMRIFLPHKNRSIEYLLEQKVLETQATGWRSNVQVFLPKMELETSYDLKKPLEELGLLSMFSDANFSGMADVPLKVDKMLQKAYLKVDEKGTEAAAVTVVTMMTTSSIGPEKVIVPVFRADRPFLFTIVHKQTNTILFAGTMEDPEAMKGK